FPRRWLARKKIHVGGSVAFHGFGPQRSAQFAKPVHGPVLTHLDREVDERWFAGTIEDVGLEHAISAARQAFGHLAARRANADDVSEMDDAGPALVPRGMVEKAPGRPIGSRNLDRNLRHLHRSVSPPLLLTRVPSGNPPGCP